ncbi:hypothetical protein NHG32_06840 [Aerococcaceae bacterium NML191219]|nr:hypothetical protein [Aerococcaceae bacterium NML191219]
MKIKFSPQINERYTVNYQFNSDNIIRIEMHDLVEDTTDIMFVDVSPIEAEYVFVPTDFISNWFVDESGELHLELLNFVGFDATEDELFPKEFEPKITSFEVTGNVLKLEAATHEEEHEGLVTVSEMREQIALAVSEVTETFTAMIEGMMPSE